ncbi:MAG: folylpolyglutamate synthase/dihydrofolate synthase family protein [Clostridium sp.]
MNYEEALNYVESTAKFGMKLGLERMERILEILDNPQKKIKTIHIAGTNGKGSTTAMLSGILKEEGYSVGMYTSPFLESFEERMQINNENISKDDFAKLITEFSIIVPKIIEENLGEPTYFEIITAVAFLYFSRKNVDYAVIEVGLGGRLDATNVITPILTIITSISFDHIGILGDTLAEIAYEKGGIIKRGIPLVLYPQDKEVREVITNLCIEKNSELIEVPRDFTEFKEVYIEDGKTYQLIKVNEEEPYNISLGLLGKHQVNNASVAIKSVEVLKKLGIKIERDSMKKAFKHTKWIGRLEKIKDNPLTVIDAAHNIGGILSLKESINTYFKYDKLILILGILADKQVHDMVAEIAPLAHKIITVTPHSDRAELSEDLRRVVQKYNSNCESYEDYRGAYEKACLYCNSGDIIVAAGSIYMIGDMRKIINRA